MISIGLSFIVYIALVMTLFMGAYTLFQSHNPKKNYFLLMQIMLFAYLLGYIMEISSAGAEEAYSGLRLMDASSSFAAAFAFFFVADYCDIKLNTALTKVPMLILPLSLTLVLWSGESQYLIYQDYTFTPGLTRYLDFTPGPLYFFTWFYPIICMVLAIIALLMQVKKWKNNDRKQLLILLISIIIPLTIDSVYYLTLLTGTAKYHLYLTPCSLALMNLCLFLGIMRFNLLQIMPRAAISALSAINYIREGFILLDGDDNYLFSNPAAEAIFPEITKLPKGESILSVKDWPVDLKNMDSGSVEFSTNMDGTTYFRASVSPIMTGTWTLKARIILLGDITDTVILINKLKNAAYIDALTNLYNRKHFTELANVDIERAQRLNHSIFAAMLDLDFFKQVNDTYGHAAGDLVLINTAAIIRQTIRSYDLLCRYGGEEFVLLITNLDMAEAQSLMERIRENLESSIINYENITIQITCSIGLFKFTEKDTLESSVKKADEALYVAKKSGRNQVRIHKSAI